MISISIIILLLFLIFYLTFLQVYLHFDMNSMLCLDLKLNLYNLTQTLFLLNCHFYLFHLFL